MAVSHRPRWWVPSPGLVGCFFLWTSGIHVGLVATDPGVYGGFADRALVPGLARAWGAVFMSHPALSGLVVATGEAIVGVVLIRGTRDWRLVGWVMVIAFQVALMCFGWGFWLWSAPVLALLLAGARTDIRREPHCVQPGGPGLVRGAQPRGG